MVNNFSDKGLTVTKDLSYIKRLSFEKFEDNINPDNISYFSSLLSERPLLLVNLASLPKIEISDYLYLTSFLSKPLLDQLMASGIFKDKLKSIFLLLNSQTISMHQDIVNLHTKLGFFTPLPKEQFKLIDNAFLRLRDSFKDRKAFSISLRENHAKISKHLNEYINIYLKQLANFYDIKNLFAELDSKIKGTKIKYQKELSFSNFLSIVKGGNKEGFNLADSVVLVEDKDTKLRSDERIGTVKDIYRRLEVDISDLRALLSLDSATSLTRSFSDFDSLITYMEGLDFKDVYTYLQFVQNSSGRLQAGMGSIDLFLSKFQRLSFLVVKTIQDFSLFLFSLKVLVKKYLSDKQLTNLFATVLSFYEGYRALLGKYGKLGEHVIKHTETRDETILDYLKDKQNLLV